MSLILIHSKLSSMDVSTIFMHCSVSCCSPSSSNGYTYPYHLGEPIGNTLYNIDYCWKPYSKQKAIRSGSSSGFRRNNPHPSQVSSISITYEKTIVYASATAKPRSQEDICRTISAQYRSIYQQDYLGMPQGFQMKYAMPRPSNIKLENPCPPLIDPECRRKPKESSDHTVCSSRYSSNKRWDIPAQGIVPTVTPKHIDNQKNSKLLTTYSTEFGKDHVDLSAIIKSLKPREIDNYLNTLPEKGMAPLHIEIMIEIQYRNFQHPTRPFGPWCPHTTIICDVL
uniref:Uncharacterized protein n=1 Tax=Callorhinchus milii TaxID=7868 RepID=A0A4W3KHM9_CALMI